MNKQLLGACALVLGVGTSLGGDSSATEITWAPAPGLRLQRVVETKHQLTAEVMRTSVNGVESLSQRAFDILSTQSVTVTDEMRSRAGGRPTEFRRYYDQGGIVVRPESPGDPAQAKTGGLRGQASVQGQGVVFTWVPEDEEYGRYFDVKEGVEEVLPGLSEDLSLRTLMPPTAVEVGDTWELEPSALAQLFACGGDLNYNLADERSYSLLRTMRLGVGLQMASVLEGEGFGDVTAMFTGTEEINGRTLARIFLMFDVNATKDVTELAAGGMTMAELVSGFRADSATVSLSLEGSGTIRWDLEGGHLYDTVDVKAAQRVGTKIVLLRDTDDGQDSRVQQLVMVGNVTHSSVCKPLD